ncbi:MAG: hypothetical protein EZS28_054202, partial [Streblomastix strix]
MNLKNGIETEQKKKEKEEDLGQQSFDNEIALKTLISIGFKKDSAKAALVAANGNVHSAVSYLIDDVLGIDSDFNRTQNEVKFHQIV